MSLRPKPHMLRPFPMLQVLETLALLNDLHEGGFVCTNECVDVGAAREALRRMGDMSRPLVLRLVKTAEEVN